MLIVYRAHQLCRWWKDLVDEDEDGLLWRKLNPFPYHVNELADGQILGNRPIDVNTLDTVEICDMRLTDGTRYFFLSIVGMSVRSAFSQIT